MFFAHRKASRKRRGPDAGMMNHVREAAPVVRLPGYPNDRQKAFRRRMRHLPLRKAVRCATDAFFRFKYRAIEAAALWSSTEHVWLGRETFFNWALCDNGIDIPWLVAEAVDVPLAHDGLRAAVVAELASYWERKLASLPRERKPCWLPLP